MMAQEEAATSVELLASVTPDGFVIAREDAATSAAVSAQCHPQCQC
jgi:hypothetical protein